MGDTVTIIDIPVLLERIESLQSFVLTTHVHPDGDALGSEAALYHFLRREGKNVRVINADAVPANLAFLESNGLFETWNPAAHERELMQADAIICLDFNQPDRVRGMEPVMRASTAFRIVIDHHLHPKPFADIYLSRTEASSTAEIVYDILTAAEFPVDRATATALYVGIMTDTGSFRFERTTPRLHRIVAELMETGLDPMAIHRMVFDDYAIGRTMLLGRILAGIEQHCDGRASILVVTGEMLSETGTTVEDVENIVNYGLAIRDVELTALLMETAEGWKISFRSRGNVAVNDIAAEFGGGGHRLASGARVDGEELSVLKQRLIQRFCRALAR
ncbi:MAG: bifunctional oligoribonuclease/PAP phosphatase NrnA [Bacteroidetes bacterium]|nr:bifunctional oligoribonuclease/PAP phosphatase NrnA [Bacteroidota bacterium]